MFDISTTFSVLKLLKSKFLILRQLANIFDMSSTLLVINLDKSKDLIFLQE